jgi:hypothetical protein
VQSHFNEFHLVDLCSKICKVSRNKMGIIKHDVAKFIGNYIIVLVLCESRMSQDTFHKILDLYKMQHPHHNAFAFIHVWYMSKKHINNFNNNGV